MKGHGASADAQEELGSPVPKAFPQLGCVHGCLYVWRVKEGGFPPKSSLSLSFSPPSGHCFPCSNCHQLTHSLFFICSSLTQFLEGFKQRRGIFLFELNKHTNNLTLAAVDSWPLPASDCLCLQTHPTPLLAHVSSPASRSQPWA